MGLAEKTVFPLHSSPTGLQVMCLPSVMSPSSCMWHAAQLTTRFVQVRASTAGWIANLPFSGLSEVIFGPDYMFAALFSPLTEDKAAADFCRRKAFQVLRTGAVSCCAWCITLCAWQLVEKAILSLTELQVLTALHPSCAGPLRSVAASLTAHTARSSATPWLPWTAASWQTARPQPRFVYGSLAVRSPSGRLCCTLLTGLQCRQP